MKALTLLQPWASLVAARVKRIETRSWQTSYRGPLAIHASAGFPRSCRDLAATPPFGWALKRCPARLPRGLVLATAELRAIYPVEAMLGQPGQMEFPFEQAGDLAGQFPFGDFSAGRFLWVLENIRPLARPVPARGSQRLWEWEESAP